MGAGWARTIRLNEAVEAEASDRRGSPELFPSVEELTGSLRVDSFSSSSGSLARADGER